MPAAEKLLNSDHETVSVSRFESDVDEAVGEDIVAVEEPLEIRIGFGTDGSVDHRPVSITMRTPGHDFDLAAGFLFTEGILSSREQISSIKHCGKGEGRGNTVRVDLVAGVEVELKRLERNFYTTSSCGVCGKSSIEALSTGACPVDDTHSLSVGRDIITELPTKLLSRQSVFERTGGLHAAGLFSPSGDLIGIREDVGRHNAVDKLIGARFLSGALPASDTILVLSGRASFELVQKAVMAGIQMVCAVGAPSSLAVRTAEEFGVTLLGFVREKRFNVYSGVHRVTR